MEEKPPKAVAVAKSLSPHDFGKFGSKRDIRNLWTKATLSQPKLNIQLVNIYKDFEQEERSSKERKAGLWYKQQKTDTETVREEKSERSAEGGIRQKELQGYPLELKPSPKPHVEAAEDFGNNVDLAASVSSVNIMKHTHHRAYWAEQQNRLPLPLMELMENEALEILTKALQSYKLAIGRNHFLTKQLQRYIEGLKRRRNRRQHISTH